MQYLLTKEEYDKLTPVRNVDVLEEKVKLLNDKVMILSGHLCGSGVSSRSATLYCDNCPIGAFGTKTCTKYQQYSK